MTAARLRAPGWIAGLSLAVWLVWRHGFANYDALYSLIWGDQLAHGHAPSYDVPLAPTPHPLSNLLGMVLSPLAPRSAEDVLVVLGFLALGAAGYLVYVLGRRWFGPAAGVLAAVILLTREPVLSYGSRAYVDVPYLVLVLWALAWEAARPRAGRGPLVLLALAGLIRPEAWLFSAAYVLWMCWGRGVRWDLVAIAAVGPVGWLLADLIAVGDPLHSLTGTRENVRALGRVTGVQHVPATLPRRVGEIVREPVLVGAVGGGLLALWLRREQARLPIAAGALAVAAYTLLAAAGLPIITRYAFVIAAIAAILCGAGAFGWLTLAREDPHRRWWMAFGVLVLVLLAVFAPSQVHRLERTRTAIGAQQAIADDLWALHATPRCPGRPLGVANHRLVPIVALDAGLAPEAVHVPPFGAGSIAGFTGPATRRVERTWVLDPRDPVPRVAAAPAGFAPVRRNASWVLWWPTGRRAC